MTRTRGTLAAVIAAFAGLWLTLAPVPATAQSDAVRRAQQALYDLGMSPGEIDGVMGWRTEEALQSFQRARNLPATGALDWQTEAALAAAVKSAQPAETRRPAAKSSDIMPPPRAAPVPEVSVAALPAPGTEPPAPLPTNDPATADRLVDAAPKAPGPAAAADAGAAAPVTGTAVAGGAPEVGPAPAATSVPAELETPTLSVAVLTAVGLGLAAAGASLGLLVWWLRDRAGRRDAPTAE